MLVLFVVLASIISIVHIRFVALHACVGQIMARTMVCVVSNASGGMFPATAYENVIVLAREVSNGSKT